LGDILTLKKMPGHIQHARARHSGGVSVIVPVGIIHAPGWTGRAVMCSGQQLPDGLDAVEQTGRLVRHQLTSPGVRSVIAFIYRTRSAPVRHSDRCSSGRRLVVGLYLDGVTAGRVEMVRPGTDRWL